MTVTKAKRHRRPSRAKRLGPAHRLLHALPKPVEELVAAQQAAEYLDDREAEARRTALAIEKAARAQLVVAVKHFDGWLEKIGLMRIAAHKAKLNRARPKKSSKGPARKRPATKATALRT